MPGSLHHAKQFEAVFYRGNDGEQHWEVANIGGTLDVVSHSTWCELLEYCAKHGVGRNVWPDFSSCECGIDVPLEEVAALQPSFRQKLLQLPPDVVAQNRLLIRIVEYLKNEESVFFCG